jgi:hypothetical protein
LDELSRQQLAGLRVATPEGDELAFCAARYHVENEGALTAALETAEPFVANHDDQAGVRSFAWLETGTGVRRSYGRIEIRGGELRLECNSQKRLAAGRNLLEIHGGEWLRHLGDSSESLEAIKQKAFSRRPSGKAAKEGTGIPPEIQRETILAMKDKHYAGWVDEQLPALEGRTPREAARTEAGRRLLEDLLRLMENGEERERRQGRPAYDFSQVRKVLGM